MTAIKHRNVARRELALPAFADLAPWRISDISLRPYQGLFSFNPSIHFDGETWRCLLRCADYGLPNGQLVRSASAKASGSLTRNALVIFDPNGWKATKVFHCNELDGITRNPKCANVGFEDLRLFRTEIGGLQAIAASLHLDRPGNRGGSCPPEQVVVSFDDAYNIVAAAPIRGPWSSAAQKNWMPFDGAEEPRFLYSIKSGTVFGAEGPVDSIIERGPGAHLGARNRWATDVRVAARPTVVNAGKAIVAGYEGIRGGSQLVAIGEDTWLGVGHEMRYVTGKKFYWHTFFIVDSAGKLLKKSAPLKLMPENGIEFAAGLVVDGDRVVISFGVDDAWCKIGETSLSALLEVIMIEPVEEAAPPAASPVGEGIALGRPRGRPSETKPAGPRIHPDAELERMTAEQLRGAYRALRVEYDNLKRSNRS